MAEYIDRRTGIFDKIIISSHFQHLSPSVYRLRTSLVQGI